jgi:hypothetical protein
MNRVCPNCYREEGIRFNFGGNFAAEADFHNQHWCSCGYSSPEEMIQDQELGFDDPRWVRIAKYFLNNYYLRLKQGEIDSKDEHIRFFLKLLKSSTNNFRLSVELVNRKNDEDWEFVYNGRPKKKSRVNIFDNAYDLEHLPKKVILDTVNDELLSAYKQSQQTITELKKDIKKNRWIAGLLVLLIILGIVAII